MTWNSTLPSKRAKPRRKAPNKAAEAVWVKPDGKEVCNLETAEGRRKYSSRTELLWWRQGKLCSFCGRYLFLDDATFDHEHGRGAGKQDDRIEVNGVPQNYALHWLCNGKKGSVYMALPHLEAEIRKHFGMEEQ